MHSITTDLDHIKKVLVLLEVCARYAVAYSDVLKQDRIHLVPDIASNASYFWIGPGDIRTKLLELSQIENKGKYC